MMLEYEIIVDRWLFWLTCVISIIVVRGVPLYSGEQIAKHGCNESCENSNIKIPYPFGIGPNCYNNSWYEITCNSSSSSSSLSSSSLVVYKPFLNKFNLEVLQIYSCLGADQCSTFELKLEVATEWQSICSSDVHNSSNRVPSIDLHGSPFTISQGKNTVVAVSEKGCSAKAKLTNRNNDSIGDCSYTCQGTNSTKTNIGSIHDGFNGCSISLPYYKHSRGIDFYQINLIDETPNTCIKVAVMENVSPDEKMVFDGVSSSKTVSTVWKWYPPQIINVSSHLIRNSSCISSFSCYRGSCHDGCVRKFGDKECQFESYDDEWVSTCICGYGYQGNPYLPTGCKVSEYLDYGDSYQYSTHRKITRATILGLSISLGSVIALLFSYGSYRIIRTQMRIRRRVKFFKKNGGLLLQQQINSSEAGVVETTKVFTADELEKATDNFNQNRVLGKGGQGTVYKGMLPDGRVVAIKKSINVDESQVEQFINEVVILSQVNHRNVVKLLGCCLETQVPLLVYEFIPNGALSEHIHNLSEDFHITWKMRLQIAVDSSGAIAYLHSSSATPVYHRDIKSSNILLDEKFKAKVSDFGTSRTITVEQTHLTTCVQGTLGYLDPEYFQSNQYTDKSDVYSFGVVLIELLTSKKPLTPTETGGWKSLAMEFLFHMETSSLSDIVDTQVAQEAKEEEIMAVANLAKRCLNLNGKRRPSMKAVAVALEGITSPTPSNLMKKSLSNVDDVFTEMSDYGSPVAFFSENGTSTSRSVEVQPLVHNSV